MAKKGWGGVTIKARIHTKNALLEAHHVVKKTILPKKDANVDNKNVMAQNILKHAVIAATTLKNVPK
jgi:hypothetical protein